LGSLSAFLWILFLDPNRTSLLFLAISALVVALIWFRHRGNIRRLIRGEEPKIWEKKL
jgi:glycerol-3-phosphate acyltransferase PlsY